MFEVAADEKKKRLDAKSKMAMYFRIKKWNHDIKRYKQVCVMSQVWEASGAVVMFSAKISAVFM